MHPPSRPALEPAQPVPHRPAALAPITEQWLEPDAANRLSQLEDRVSLLEASTSMTYGMLKKVLRALRIQRSVEKDVS